MELQRRCNTLIMLIEKEMNEIEEREKLDRKKNKGTAAGNVIKANLNESSDFDLDNY